MTIMCRYIIYLSFYAFIFTAPVASAQDGVTHKETGQFLGSATAESPPWFKDSFLEFEEDIREAASNNKRLMIFVHQDGCPYCAKLVNENFKQKNIAALVKNNFDGISINMWGDRDLIAVGGKSYTEKSFSEALKVQYTPTLLFFTEKGKIALRINGYYPPDKFRMALDYVISHKESEQSFNDYVAMRTRTATTGKLNTEPFFSPPPHDLSRSHKIKTRPLAVFFEQGDCENCDILHQKILTDKPTRLLMNKFDSVQLNMWANTPVITPNGVKTTARDWARELEIGYAPSVVYFDAKGEEVARVDAFMKTFHFQSLLDYVLTKAYLTQPNFQRFISQRAEHIREQGHDVDIWSYKSHHTE